MNNENGKINDTIEGVFRTANNELFDGYKLAFESSSRILNHQERDITGDNMMSLLNASGEGVKVLACIKMNIATARYIYPGDGASAALEDLQDLCGELNNQLVGKLKNKLLSYDCKLMLGLPTCVTGKNVSSHSPQNAVIAESIYKADAGVVVVSLHTIVHPAFEMLDAPNNDLAGEVSEGTLSFF